MDKKERKTNSENLNTINLKCLAPIIAVPIGQRKAIVDDWELR